MPNTARVYSRLLSGKDHFPSDRAEADLLLEIYPPLAEMVQENRAFLAEAVTWTASQGIGQFIDLGAGLPATPAVHQTAQAILPAARVAYVDLDPMVLSHARALLKSAPGGAVGYVDADVRDPGAIVEGARSILDFGQPVAIMLLFTLAYVQDGAEAAAVVSSLAAAVPSGSYVAIYHLASDLDVSMEEAARQWNKMMPSQAITLRSGAEIASLAAGLVPVPPGLAPVNQWRPSPADPRFEHGIPVHGLVARKP